MVITCHHMDINIGFVVVDHVVQGVAFILIQADILGVNGDMIGE